MSVQRSNINCLGTGEYRLINLVKEGQSPFNNVGGPTGYQSTDALTGYPTELISGVSFGVVLRPDTVPIATNYVVKWQGLGSYNHTSFGTLTGAARTRNGVVWNTASSATQATNGRMTFVASPSNGSPAGSFTSAVVLKGDGRTGASNQLTNFIICRADEEDYLDDQMFAGVPEWRIFRPGYISQLQSYKPRCLRFMNDDQRINTNIQSNWTDRPSLNALSLNCTPYNNIVSSAATLGLISWAGTAGVTDNYSCDAYSGMPGSYTHGEVIQGHVTVSNTVATPTLNVGGRGAKPILNGTGGYPINPVVGGANAQTALLAGVQPSGNGSYSFVYDAYHGPGATGTFGSGAWIFTPNGPVFGRRFEHIVAVCNAANIPGWFCVPAYATDDYVTQMGNYLVANYTPSEVNIEYANEIWNIALGFTSSGRIIQWGVGTFTSPPISLSSNAPMHSYYGLRFRQIAQILRPLLGSKLKMIFGMQGSDGDLLVNLTGIDQRFRLQNVDYPSMTGANAPYLFADYHAYAWYHRPTSCLGDQANVGWAGLAQATTLKSYIDIWTANNSDTTGFVWLRDQWLADAAITSRLVAGGRCDLFNTQATNFNNVQVALYEMNQQIDAPNAAFCGANAPWNDSSYGDQGGKINMFLLAFYASSYFQTVTNSILTQFYSYSRSLSASVYGTTTGQPWLTFPKLPAQVANNQVGGNMTQIPYGNWVANAAWNNKTTRTFTVKN